MKKRISALVFALVLMVMTAVPVFAAGGHFIENFENQEVPRLVASQLLDENGDPIAADVSLSYISIGDADAAGKLGDAISNAKKNIEGTKRISNVIPALKKEVGKDKADKYVVTELFGIDLETENKEAKFMSVRLTPKFVFDDDTVVVYKTLGGKWTLGDKWEVVEATKAGARAISEDITINVPAESGVVAFLKYDANKEITANDFSEHPNFWSVFAPIGIIVIIAVVITDRKRTK